MTTITASGSRRRPRPDIVRDRLVFGRMYEDAEVDAGVLPPGRVLCVASAGDTALRLAADGREVVAVDVNRAQVRYVRDRLAGGPAVPGSVERMLRRSRRVLQATAWRGADLPAFCALDDLAEQRRRWQRQFDTRTFRAVLAAALSPVSVRGAGFGAFTGGVGRFDTLMRARLLDGLGRHPNRTNPYLAALLLDVPAPVPAPAPTGSVRVHCADLVEYLESEPAGSFAGFSLSNVVDGAPTQYCRRLSAAVRRASAPGAVAIWRTFRRGATADEREWAARDRGLLWGGVRITQPRDER
jgi:hypothetical protein